MPLVVWVVGLGVGIALMFLPVAEWFVFRPWKRILFKTVRRDKTVLGYLDYVSESRQHKRAIDVWLWVIDRLMKPIFVEFSSEVSNAPISVADSPQIRKELRSRANVLGFRLKLGSYAINHLEKAVENHHEGVGEIVARFSKRDSQPWFTKRDISEADEWSSKIISKLRLLESGVSVVNRNIDQNFQSSYTLYNQGVLESLVRIKELLDVLNVDAMTVVGLDKCSFNNRLTPNPSGQ